MCYIPEMFYVQFIVISCGMFVNLELKCEIFVVIWEKYLHALNSEMANREF